MDKTLTTQFILWLGRQEIHLYREDTSWVNPDSELPDLMDRFIDEWFAPAQIRARYNEALSQLGTSNV